jgi:hypothetical protein
MGVLSVTRDDAATYTILASRPQEAARQGLDGYREIVIVNASAPGVSLQV